MLDPLKHLLKKKLRLRGYDIQKKLRFLLSNPSSNLNFDLEIFVRSALYETKELHLMQIGAYDGVTNDPIHQILQRYPIRAILVEPNRDVFSTLLKNYVDNRNVILENVAVAEQSGEKTFYRLRGQDCSLQQLSSFSRETILGHRGAEPDIEKWIHQETVPCKTVSALLKEHQFPALDILVIDVEGYEDAIIRSIDLRVILPQIILYESCHLRPETQEALCELLFKFGYKISVLGSDTIAVTHSRKVSVSSSAPGARPE